MKKIKITLIMMVVGLLAIMLTATDCDSNIELIDRQEFCRSKGMESYGANANGFVCYISDVDYGKDMAEKECNEKSNEVKSTSDWFNDSKWIYVSSRGRPCD